MPRYKVLQKSYIDGRMYEASTDEGAVYVDGYEGNPGPNLEPVDDEGRARQAAYYKSRGMTLPQANRMKRVLTEGAFDENVLGAVKTPVPTCGTPPPVVDHVAIPADWATLDAGKTMALAAKLGAPTDVTTRAAAQAFIKTEVDKRMGRAAAPDAA